MFRRLAPQGASPREISEVVNNILNGKTNNTGSITLDTGGASTTTLYDERISPDSKIIILPASAAAFADTAPYGMFSNNTDQLAPSAGTSAVVTWDTTEFSNGVTLSNTTRLNVANGGLYNVQFSLQLQNSTNDGQFADVWFRVNGADVVRSASRFGLPARKSMGDPSHLIGSMNAFLDLDAGDYIEIAGAVSNVGVSLEHFPADTGIPRPAIPAAIITLDYIAPLAYSDVYVSSQGFGQATITHWANSTANKTYSYVIVG
jgi:hypothetical protein